MLDRPHLILINSHKSHVYNYPFFRYMLSNNIQVMAIPPHCSHIVQPLDNCPFSCQSLLCQVQQVLIRLIIRSFSFK